MIRAAEPHWRQMDVMLLPTTGTTYRIDAVLADPIALNSNLGLYTNFVNLMDLSAIAVLPGQHVTRGEVIGYVGQTGRATGPHLHYEVRVHNVPVNPHKYLRETYAQAEKLDGAQSGS